MQISLQQNRHKQNHRKLLTELIASANVSILCCGWFKHDGLSELIQAIDYAISRAASITVISNREHTELTATCELAKRPQIKHLITTEDFKYLHTKLYYFEQDKQYTAIVGSANITRGALISNEELSAVFKGQIGESMQQSFKRYLHGLMAALHQT